MRTTDRVQVWRWTPLVVVVIGALCFLALAVSLLVWDAAAWQLIVPLIGLVIACVGFVAARHLP